MKDIAIYGAGGFGREVALLIEQLNQQKRTWNLLGFYDDHPSVGSEVYGYKILGGMEALNRYEKNLQIVVAVGNPEQKKRIVSRISAPQVGFPVLIHPTAIAGSKDGTIGEGSIITAGSIITVNANIGAHVIINLACTIGHDAIIGNYCSLMPAVNVSGNVEIEAGAFIGTGAKVINNLKIGAGTVVGAGAVVTKSLPANCTAVGVPAKPISFREGKEQEF